MDIIRAWKDEEYRLSLTEEQRALLPDNPAGTLRGRLGECSGWLLQFIYGVHCWSWKLQQQLFVRADDLRSILSLPHTALIHREYRFSSR